MIKGLFRFILFTLVLLVGAIKYTPTLQEPILNSLSGIKVHYYHSIEKIENFLDIHFAQAKQIQQLQLKLKRYEKNHLVMRELANDLNDLFNENNSLLHTDPRVTLVRAISYAQFGDLNKLWLDITDYNSSKIYGLTYKEYVAGIVIFKDDKPMALLNKDIKSSYAVYVGKHKAPGIAHGNNSKNIMVRFIPAWFKINIGDEIITSGLDNIFFKGLRVGKVISISSSQGYQNAIVEPYFNANEVNYFHMITKVK